MGFLGIIEILGIVLVTLKLSDKIDWSWWWVLCPIWVPFVIAIAMFTIFAIVEPGPKK